MSQIVQHEGAGTPTQTLDALVSSTPWLRSWTPADPLPDGVAQRLPALIAVAEQMVRPADGKAFAVAMERLLGWAERFSIYVPPADERRRRREIQEITVDYRAALADVPADLMMVAIEGVIRTYSVGADRYRRLPLPGDLRAVVAAELDERRSVVRRLRSAELKASLEQKAAARHACPPASTLPPASADPARVADIVAKSIRRVDGRCLPAGARP